MWDVFKQYLDLLEVCGIKRPIISFTGGEPFLRKDFLPLLKKIRKQNRNSVLRILSNGSMINENVAEELKHLKLSFVQISLEGLKDNNDKIRGEGSFEKIVESIKIIRSHKIDVVVSFTLNQLNKDDIPGLADLCCDLGVKRLGIGRLVPFGRGEQLKEKLLSPQELKKFYLNAKELEKEFRNKLEISYSCEQGILALEKKTENYCIVMDGRGLTVMPNGDVLFCRRLPIKLGNVLEQDLKHIYFNNHLLWEIKELDNISHEKCKKCKVFDKCFGGAKCITYAYFNRLSEPDPQCWHAFRELPTR